LWNIVLKVTASEGLLKDEKLENEIYFDQDPQKGTRNWTEGRPQRRQRKTINKTDSQPKLKKGRSDTTFIKP